jgi:uncharacterized protein (DUF433 family)
MTFLTERITTDPNLCGGKPTIRGLGITVQQVLGALATGISKQEVVSYFPELELEDVDGAISFLDKVAKGEIQFRLYESAGVKEPRPEYNKVFRLWKHIKFADEWANCDTSVLDDISESWFKRREYLQTNSHEYAEFLERLKREHAIETGVVERMYDLSKGITETFIKVGFHRSYLTHGDTNIPEATLMSHLKDHLEAVDFVFDIVKEDRSLSISFIKQLHQLVTRHQHFAEGRDQFGNNLKIPLLKGQFKKSENNPTRDDGTLVMYCPPEHVESEMDNLVDIYDLLTKDKVHPLVIASWFHHAFTTIHPFQDGNGRVARLLTSLIFVKSGYFPFTVLREEAKVHYIEGLEAADRGEPQKIVAYFGDVQKRNIQNALNIKEVSSLSLAEVQSILVQKIRESRKKAAEQYRQVLQISRRSVYEYCDGVLQGLAGRLQKEMGKMAVISHFGSSFDDDRTNEHGVKRSEYFFKQIVGYAKKHDYYYNRTFPKAWLAFKIEINKYRNYQLVFTLHHFGYDDSTLAIGAFLEHKIFEDNDSVDTTLPLPIPPHVISINGDMENKKKNIRQFLENALTLAMAHVASDL